MKHALTHEAEVRANGGLSASTKKLLRKLACGKSAPRTNTSLTPGTRLIREWNGNTYIVDVTDTSFKMDRREFKSLSAAATAITGSHWNGRAFFGLNKRSQKPMAAGINQ